ARAIAAAQDESRLARQRRTAFALARDPALRGRRAFSAVGVGAAPAARDAARGRSRAARAGAVCAPRRTPQGTRVDIFMKLLALDTSTDACSVALSVDGESIERVDAAPRHGERLLTMVQEVLAAS